MSVIPHLFRYLNWISL